MTRTGEGESGEGVEGGGGGREGSEWGSRPDCRRQAEGKGVGVGKGWKGGGAVVERKGVGFQT